MLPSELDEDDKPLWSGFSAACIELRAWADATLPRVLFYDDECGMLSDGEPEGWQDEDGQWIEPEPYYRVEWREILAAVFPSKLSEYL